MEIMQVSEEDDEVDKRVPEGGKSVQYRGLTVRYVGKHLIEY